MFPSRIMASGISAGAANQICGGVVTAISAAGTTNADATALSASVNVVSTTGTGAGVKLPPVERSALIEVYNQGANALLVYPPANAKIDALTTTSGGFSVGADKAARFRAVSGTQIYSMLGA